MKMLFYFKIMGILGVLFISKLNTDFLNLSFDSIIVLRRFLSLFEMTLRDAIAGLYINPLASSRNRFLVRDLTGVNRYRINPNYSRNQYEVIHIIL